jgi:hypothetical protein
MIQAPIGEHRILRYELSGCDMARRPAYPNHVGPIGGTIRMGHGLWVHCENREFLHRARVDLEAIAERFGAKLSVAEFVNRSVCSECGARWPNISISLEPGGTRGAKMGYTVGRE